MIQEHKRVVVSENTIISLDQGALLHHLNQIYDEETIDAAKQMLRSLAAHIEASRIAQVDCTFKIDRSGVASMRLGQLNIP